MLSKEDVDQFEQAFDMHIAGAVCDCACGKLFWDCVNSGYDWNEGERESLMSNPNATAVHHGVSRIFLEGSIYVMDCTCWHDRAERIVEWLRCHQSAIAEWFRLEKRRLQKAAEDVPTIEDAA